MQIYDDNTGIKYYEGYFVVYTNAAKPTATPRWIIAQTYKSIAHALRMHREHEKLIPLWEESKLEAGKQKPAPDNFKLNITNKE